MWRRKYRHKGRENRLALGTYPDTTLKLAREWLGMQEKKMAAATFAKAKWTFETLMFPVISSRPIAKLAPSDILRMLQVIEKRGTYETAHRTRQRCAQVFRHAVQTDRAERDATADLRGALAPVVTAHHASNTEPALVGQLLRDIDAYHGYVVTRYALQLVREPEFTR